MKVFSSKSLFSLVVIISTHCVNTFFEKSSRKNENFPKKEFFGVILTKTTLYTIYIDCFSLRHLFATVISMTWNATHFIHSPQTSKKVYTIHELGITWQAIVCGLGTKAVKTFSRQSPTFTACCEVAATRTRPSNSGLSRRRGRQFALRGGQTTALKCEKVQKLLKKYDKHVKLSDAGRLAKKCDKYTV